MTKTNETLVAEYVFENLFAKIECPKLTRDYQTVCTIEISPKSLGPFAPAIQTMTAKVKAGINEKTIYIVVEYSYNHTDGGRNGKDVRVTIPAAR